MAASQQEREDPAVVEAPHRGELAQVRHEEAAARAQLQREEADARAVVQQDLAAAQASVEALQDAVETHQPPLVSGRRIKLRYAHLGGQNPPVIVIHGNQTESVPNAYKRYLENIYRKVLRIEGTPIAIEFKTGDNPAVV